MADWSYLAIDTAGRERRGRLGAATRTDATERLAQRSLYVVKLDEAAADSAEATPFFQLTRNKLTQKELTLVTRQLAEISQVTPLEETLRLVSRQSDRPHVRRIVGSVRDGVAEGRRLADAMGREPKSFPALYRATVSAGEGSGTLPEILERLSTLLERQAAIRSKVLSALAYPIVLAIVAMVVVAALMVFVVPKVVEQFDDVGQQLPFLTRAVMWLSAIMAGYWWAILIGLVLLGVLAWYLLKDERNRLAFDTWLLRVPLIGRLIRDLHAARLARTLSTMVASRLPILEGMRLTAQTVHNRRLRLASDNIVQSIRAGGSLSAGLREAGVFPPILVYLAAGGESAGRLDTMLARAAETLEREFDAFTAGALSLLEPLIIIVMGVVVATIVLAILLPILQLQSLAGT